MNSPKQRTRMRINAGPAYPGGKGVGRDLGGGVLTEMVFNGLGGSDRGCRDLSSLILARNSVHRAGKRLICGEKKSPKGGALDKKKTPTADIGEGQFLDEREIAWRKQGSRTGQSITIYRQREGAPTDHYCVYGRRGHLRGRRGGKTGIRTIRVV